MTLTNVLRVAGFSTLLFACAGIAAAQGPVAGAGTTTSELTMGANVETALQLNITTGTNGATVVGAIDNTSTGEFTIDFGDVNGLGVGATQSANVTVAADATGATYTTPINLTPVYSGFGAQTADVTVEAGGGGAILIALEGAAANSVTSVTTAVPAFSNAASDSENERFVGFRISRAEAPGAKVATLIYTVTMGI